MTNKEEDKGPLEPRVLFHRGSSMVGAFCCGKFYQDSLETFETEEEAKKALASGSYQRIGFVAWQYSYGNETVEGLRHCTLVERPAPTWTGVEKSSMMIPLPEKMILEFLKERKHEVYLSEEEKIFLIDGYTEAQWDAAEAKAKAWLRGD
jgi:hypothetical protein